MIALNNIATSTAPSPSSTRTTAQEMTLAHRASRRGADGYAAVCSEIQKTWNRDDAQQWAEAYSAVCSRHTSC